ncbi:aminoglycoside phosphotransferase family protein [Spirillospora albida]|uniref:aminoglycoside phosphotransferase family protein n=1 Tax=Spirillospora albida TaxID=58123 RepID=UPI000A02F839|nr:aminoglycoside phosphotransferase family protein [Spirillospora albida]
MNGRELYERARANGDAAAGYYNDNVRVDTADGPVIVRIPIHGADMMDLRPWREDRVLAAIAPYVRDAPRLLLSSEDPRFQVHEFIAGDVLNEVAPRGVAVPPHVLDDVVRLFVQLTDVPRLPDTPDGWPADGDTTAFAHLLSALTHRVHVTYGPDFADLFAALAIPAEPLAPVNDLWRGLTPRPFACVHADVHRRNMIVREESTTFLDWELALWGDPVYDLAVHIHKMGYLPDERDALITRWLAAMPSEHTAGWERDLDGYLTHERIKSAIVDSVRYSQLFAKGGPYPYPERQLVASMTAKLNAARPYWDLMEPVDERDVDSALRGG